jgi:hypothetical protein
VQPLDPLHRWKRDNTEKACLFDNSDVRWNTVQTENGSRGQTVTHAALTQALARCDTNRERVLADLFRLLRQPSISTQGIGVAECIT